LGVKRVEAVIRSEKLLDVRRALTANGFLGITVYDVKGRGRQKGLTLQVRGREYSVDLLPKTKIELVVKDEDVERVIDLIMRSAATGKIGDGKIFILPIEDVVRIRTGERRENAI